MSKFDYVIMVLFEKITQVRHVDMYDTYEREAGNMGQDLKITAEDCKVRVRKFQNQIDELMMAIEILKREGKC